MKHTILISLFCPLFLLACERAGDSDPPDAAPDENVDAAPDDVIDAGTVQPPPGQSEPVELDCREQNDGYRSYGERQRQYYAIAEWGTDAPDGIVWVCYDYDFYCGNGACSLVGELREIRCTQQIWMQDVDGTYFVGCGYRADYDADGDGTFDPDEIGEWALASRVYVTQP